MGYAGACTNIFIFAGCLAYTHCIEELKGSLSWPGLKSFEGLGTYFKLGIPCFLSTYLEWVAYELMGILCGYIGVNEQASQFVILNLVSFIYCFTHGLGVAINCLVGQSIGDGKIEEGKQYLRAGMLFAVVYVLSLNMSFFFYLEEILRMIITNEKVIELCVQVAPLAVLG
mmetsp:Transcript_30081/g.45961  ORF Transcript_30081/g.45961 Transcript_30081/m.45961 type:complete len:171 (+) Transcript_30081:711-1223(+)|eukprot:CAMPEP_0170499696 /NCGR_PEP_ID=MMETSP0208-20121228/32240_1 /TAXON_ID=197538 /ORGANISM="Strombidium inclinatum, Strain S3" /LENGTH=170 /DNA_ID=CAMNT_0010777361 /DNA_START=646 /DNA_END=1158 /DNA_ORIENTATION=-